MFKSQFGPYKSWIADGYSKHDTFKTKAHLLHWWFNRIEITLNGFTHILYVAE